MLVAAEAVRADYRSCGQGCDSSGSLSSPVIRQYNRNLCTARRSQNLKTHRGLAASPRSSILAHTRLSAERSIRPEPSSAVPRITNEWNVNSNQFVAKGRVAAIRD